eukprot:scaffold3668_cov97-Cylindrotheca_fusiformis.AAC.1
MCGKRCVDPGLHNTQIIEETFGVLGSQAGGMGLSGGNVAEGHKEGVVDGAGVEEHCAGDFLDSFGAGGIQRIGFIKGFRGLDALTVLGNVEAVWGILFPTGWRVFVFFESGGDVTGHGEVTGAIRVVPFEGDATVEGGAPINRDGFVVLAEDVEEVVGIGERGVLDGEIVDNQREDEVFAGVFPKAGCVAALEIAVGFESFFEEHVGELAGLGKAVHSFVDADINEVVGEFGSQVVFFHDLGWYE